MMQDVAIAAPVARFLAAPAYAGYRDADRKLPYARFLRDVSAPLQPQIVAAMAAGMAPPETGLAFADFARQIIRPGYLPLETGWTRLADGVVLVAALTHMPRVRAHMWAWWFGWHGTPDRYKLWCPEAHLVAMWADATPEAPGPVAHIGRVSYIREWIGDFLLQGSIRFVDPAALGIAPDAFDGVMICGRAGEVEAPVEHTWVLHQLRNTADGCEMRSRFYLGQDPCRVGGGALPQPPAGAVAQPHHGPDPVALLHHCGQEMNHLAQFLPELYAAFGPGN